MTEDHEISWAPSLSRPNVLERKPLNPKRSPSIHPFASPHFTINATLDTEENTNATGFFALSRPSFFLIALALMVLGVCFFAAGFGTGWWTAKHKRLETSNASKPSAGAGFSPYQMNALLEIVGAAGGNTGRMAYAAQRALDAQPAGGESGVVGISSSVPIATSTSPTSLGNQSAGIPVDEESGFLPSPPPSAATKTSYFVQLGAYATQRNALELIQYLNLQSIPAFLVQGKKTDGTPIFYVRTGAYGHFEVAQTVAKHFTDESGLSATVVAPAKGEKRLNP